MEQKKTHQIINIIIAAIWLINGLYCKVLGFVPRHEQIVGSILGQEHAGFLTILIGLSEIMMAFWILSRIKIRLNAMTQLIIVGAMNVLEFVLVPDLLLWGKLNALFALLFMLVVYLNEYQLNKRVPLL